MGLIHSRQADWARSGCLPHIVPKDHCREQASLGYIHPPPGQERRQRESVQVGSASGKSGRGHVALGTRHPPADSCAGPEPAGQGLWSGNARGWLSQEENLGLLLSAELLRRQSALSNQPQARPHRPSGSLCLFCSGKLSPGST